MKIWSLTLKIGQIWNFPYRGIGMITSINETDNQCWVLIEKSNEEVLMWKDHFLEATLIG
jgi:hypothetical protein